jgi:hypothetical protein
VPLARREGFSKDLAERGGVAKSPSVGNLRDTEVRRPAKVRSASIESMTSDPGGGRSLNGLEQPVQLTCADSMNLRNLVDGQFGIVQMTVDIGLHLPEQHAARP